MPDLSGGYTGAKKVTFILYIRQGAVLGGAAPCCVYEGGEWMYRLFFLGFDVVISHRVLSCWDDIMNIHTDVWGFVIFDSGTFKTFRIVGMIGELPFRVGDDFLYYTVAVSDNMSNDFCIL